MRGLDEQTSSLFSYMSCEARVPASHPLRRIRAVVDEALDVLSPDFDGMPAQGGRPSIAPEKLLRALLLQAFYSVRFERQLMEQLDYNLLFRWFVGLSMDAAVWDASTFSKNRDRFLDGDAAQRLLTAILDQPRVRALMSDEHFSVDQADVTTQGRDQADAGKAGVGDQAAALQPAPRLQDGLVRPIDHRLVPPDSLAAPVLGGGENSQERQRPAPAGPRNKAAGGPTKVPGQSRRRRGGPKGAETWPGAVFSPA
jgi:transposase